MNYSKNKKIPTDGLSIKEPALIIDGKKVENIRLEEAVPGQIIKEETGEFLLVKRELHDLHKNADTVTKLFEKSVNINNGEPKFSDLRKTGDLLEPSKILFMDIETCGLNLEPLFLIGAAYFTGDSFKLIQLFARDFSEERTLLAFYKNLLGHYDYLFTYNGRSFDIPYIRSRSNEYNIAFQDDFIDIDLLIEVRRRWKSRLPDCKLQTVERCILERKRTGDIPGKDIPAAYRDYVNTGNAYKIRNILEHNVIDIISLIEIFILFSYDV
ncbi:MAG: ribonuclease H-like domain-containing protein [bacterium]|nr:ribonuclease H-like domain-containing protein [bacterium]